ncbi:hypothetical protein [Luteolibacter sp. LG18]|uniref:hypothetical protein n=1 Tax=Luteolibacter sp. LG18 TaxID=2819286 RepID=UPI002B2D5177|nr:hypothetical protein llg_34010 [Luteolibacter sp. LG18]
MFPKAVIGLFLALVFQLAQIAPCLAATCTPSTATRSETCGCCDKPDACPCATNQKEHDRSTPIAPPAPELKAQLALPALDPVATVGITIGTTASRHLPPLFCERAAGYAGVSLPVAFCSFLI